MRLRGWIRIIISLGVVLCLSSPTVGQLLPKPKPITDKKKEAFFPKLDRFNEPPELPKLSPKIEGTPISANGPLSLEEVLGSVEEHYPLLRAVEQERTIANGRYVQAMGAFDTNFRLNSFNQTADSTYENYRFLGGIEQAFPFTGVNFFSTYRGGFGEFPVYQFDRKTADGGEFRTGLNVPFLRDSSIDRRRANLQQAMVGVQAAEPVIERSRLDYLRGAARAYWTWFASGRTLKLSERLLELARERDNQFKGLIEGKFASPLDRAQNQSTILSRNSTLIQSERAFQQASIDLSLYLRDSQGRAILPTRDRLPASVPIPAEIDSVHLKRGIELAQELRPEPRRIRLTRQTSEIELKLALNQTLPSLNGFVNASQDIGRGKPATGPNRLDRSVLEAGVELQLPIQRRDARGRVTTAQAQLIQLQQQEAFLLDSIRIEVQSTFLFLDRAYELYRQAKARVELARTVAESFRERFRLGDADILTLTLMEQSEFEAELAEVSAHFEYFRALADFQAAVGIGAKQEP